MLELDVTWRRGRFCLQAKAELGARVTGLCGPSGSGKSSLLALIAGLQRPDSGVIRLNGTTLVDTQQRIWLPPEQRHIGMVFQDAQLFPHLSVESNLLYGWKRRQPDERCYQLAEVVELLEIGHLLKRRPRHLSGGERQRVALGRALLYAPRLLLLDEPLAALDSQRKQQILPFLQRLREESGIPMVYVSHAIEELDYISDEVWICEQGRLSQSAQIVSDVSPPPKAINSPCAC
jgi:molybdate transport system ATP-binding protein